MWGNICQGFGVPLASAVDPRDERQGVCGELKEVLGEHLRGFSIHREVRAEGGGMICFPLHFTDEAAESLSKQTSCSIPRDERRYKKRMEKNHDSVSRGKAMDGSRTVIRGVMKI